MSVRYSHPPEDDHQGVMLGDHLHDVARRVRAIIPEHETTPSGEPLPRVVETLALVHDFGKATTFFQEYLRHDMEPEFKACRYHAPIGSFAAYYALDVQGFDTETCLAGFVAVAKHHGRLPDVTQYIYDRAYKSDHSANGARTNAEQQQAAIAMQLNDIEGHVSDFASEIFEEATNCEGSWGDFRQSYKQLLDKIAGAVATESGLAINRESLSSSCYGLLLEMWGSLVLADKTSAASRSENGAGSGSTYIAEQPSLQVLDEYIADLEASSSADPNGSRPEQLNHYRSRARSAVVSNAKEFAESGGGVATLTLPTGMGKTLTGLSAAQTIRDERGGERIVYALPFTSIIDQVVDEMAEIYDTNTLGRLLTAHHHLSETKIVDEGDINADEVDKNDDVAGMLAESWRAGLTVTTFVQLFESLAGPANKQSMKIPALYNSVIILDEPQSVPLDWWKLVPRLVTVLTEQYDATVIAMTATQPQLFAEATDAMGGVPELVDDPHVYFDATERVTYELDVSTERYIETQAGPKSYVDAGADLLTAVAASESALAVCNTIDSARALYDELVDHRSLVSVGDVYAEALETVAATSEIDPPTLATKIQAKSDRSILFLSTRLRPVDRLKLIETAKALTDSGHRLITVSTQLIEAGVDISFDRVYRDLAPIDSIVQAAGRCNRSFEREQGQVIVWWLGVPDEQQKTPAEAVYNRGATLLPVAAETLDAVRTTHESLPETAVSRTAVTEYYRKLHADKNVGKQEYATYVDAARGDKLASLSLIDQRNAVDIIICRTDSDRARVEQVRDAWTAYEFDRVRQLMDELKEARVSVPIYPRASGTLEKVGQLNPIHSDSDVRYLDVRDHGLGQYFDQDTGFVLPDSTAERRIL